MFLVGYKNAGPGMALKAKRLSAICLDTNESMQMVSSFIPS